MELNQACARCQVRCCPSARAQHDTLSWTRMGGPAVSPPVGKPGLNFTTNSKKKKTGVYHHIRFFHFCRPPPTINKTKRQLTSRFKKTTKCDRVNRLCIKNSHMKKMYTRSHKSRSTNISIKDVQFQSNQRNGSETRCRPQLRWERERQVVLQVVAYGSTLVVLKVQKFQNIEIIL